MPRWIYSAVSSSRARTHMMWIVLHLGESGNTRSRTSVIQIYVHLYHLRKQGRSGRPLKWIRDDVREAVSSSLALHQRRTIRSIATALDIPKLTVFRMKQDNHDTVIMPRSIAVKPLLTDVHKVQRVLFVTSKLTGPENHFHHFYDSVHVDEKWFFISEKMLRVYCCCPDEVVPERNAQKRDHLINVMFFVCYCLPTL